MYIDLPVLVGQEVECEDKSEFLWRERRQLAIKYRAKNLGPVSVQQNQSEEETK